jgi:ribosomal protein S18 acetylase RimI-like enzyme
MNIRPFTEDDAPVVAALIAAEEERLYGRPGRLTGADILMFLHWSKEAWVWEEDGRIVASATYGVHGDAADIRGIVADKGRGLGAEIIERGEAFYEALNESFAEHWEWHPKPVDEWIELRQGQHRDEHGPVWFVVRDGNELAGVTRNDASVAGGGYVGAIGVRPAWRGKGVAKALLQRTFAEFWRRGTTRVTLDVDSQNATGAVALYERVGMYVDSCGVAFEKANE